MKCGYLLVEGYDDVELIGGILKSKDIIRVQQKSNLLDYWSPIIPISFPYKGDLTKRIPVPAFFQNDEFSVAIHCVEGGPPDMARKWRFTLENVPEIKQQMVGIGIIGDADADVTSTFNIIKNLFADILQLPDTCGEISNDTPRTGVFLFPDNQNSGTIEKVLLRCAENTYSEILSRAQQYIQSVDQNVTGFDRNQFDKPAGKEKATIGCISNILKPGKAVQVSIQDNNWVCRQTIENTDLSKLNIFITELLQMM